MHYGVQPDLLCCGKGISSSVPLSAVLGSREVMDLPDIGSMSSTHSANPFVCAAGLANLKELVEGGLIEASAKLGALFHKRLNKIKARFPKHISDVCGKGLVAAVIFNSPPDRTPRADICNAVAELCMQRGLIVVHTGRESIKLAPPLSIPEDAMNEGLDVLEQAIADVIEKLG